MGYIFNQELPSNACFLNELGNVHSSIGVSAIRLLLCICFVKIELIEGIFECFAVSVITRCSRNEALDISF